MHKLSTRIALLAFVGTLSVIPAAFAAPTGTMYYNNGGTTAGQNDVNKTPAIDCSLPVNKFKDECRNAHQFGQHGSGPNSNTNPNPNPNPNPTTNNNTNNNGGMFGNRYNGPKPGTFNFNQQDRSFFHRHFNGFNFGSFGFFGAPTFSITIGTNIPFRYHNHLRHVPASVYRFYPWFRGYFFFVTARGDFVIVSPRTFRIVAVL